MTKGLRPFLGLLGSPMEFYVLVLAVSPGPSFLRLPGSPWEFLFQAKVASIAG